MARKDTVHVKKHREKKRRPGVHSKNNPPEKKYRGQGK